jgi:hypothetical protein
MSTHRARDDDHHGRIVYPLSPEQEAVRVSSDEHRRLVRERIDPMPEHFTDEPAAYLSPPHNRATAQPPIERPALADEQRILDVFAKEVRVRGLVGEERNAATLYLVLTSRLLDRPVSAGVKGHSSSGKSYLVETVLGFFPKAAVVEFTAMSQRALVYSKESYAHRTIVVYELTALREGIEDDLTSYFVRSLLSEGRLEYEVTVPIKDGGFTTRKITKEGPTNLIFTTTQTRVHHENETRVLALHTDDSTAQTARVLLELAKEGAARDPDEWRALQAWLAGGETRVTIPYARQLARAVPPVAVRLRRDFGALLALIRAHALLHRGTRTLDYDGRIIATLDDYAAVRELVGETIAAGVNATVSETVHATVAAVELLAPDTGIMARAVGEHLGIDKSNASRRLRVAADDGYVTNLEEKRGKPGRWVLGDPLPEAVEVLPEPDALIGCAVARDAGGMTYTEPEEEGQPV